MYDIHKEIDDSTQRNTFINTLPTKNESGIVPIHKNHVIALEFGGQSVKAARVDPAGNLTGP